MYWDRVYNDMEVELVREICADPIVRHDPESVTSLSHDEQIERILRTKPLRPYFTHRVLHADDAYVTSVWNMVTRDGRNAELCGIEVFRAENGRFTDCWNSTYMKGHWGEAGDSFDPAALVPPPLIDSADRIDAGADHSPQKRCALPHTILWRSSSGTFTNRVSITLRE
jgi:hypothetical protein